MHSFPTGCERRERAGLGQNAIVSTSRLRHTGSVMSLRYLLALVLAGSAIAQSLGVQPPPAAGAAKQEPPKWDVNNPPGPRQTIPIDTTTGTWMNLDVSPDGKEIVFDMLGDIYSVSIAGGEARSLTSGLAWDMQPRFSPDGRKIAFTSDRAGGDNIWIMDRDGSHLQQVTKESFRLLNNPTWSPDGQYIVARKHFTASRSLGAGEMWIYHMSGGDGLQLTKKANDQKDTNDPAFSPDGRYLYYDEDITPGQSFEYNKNPNETLYGIKRLDRTTGETIVLLGDNGSSMRPTPSPDGKRLAFVRRIRTHTALFVVDLASGSQQQLYDGLERDMQETWSIHGLYTGIAWTPDNKSIVFWASGNLHRIEVDTKRLAAIPFHVKTTREATEALRFPVEVAPADFEVKMLRDVTVSPQRDFVVYEALGKLYRRGLPPGTPARLTQDPPDSSQESDLREFNPAFSRDGRYLAYATWDDVAEGSIRIRNLATGETRVITREPGHYAEPAFSPDGSTIVFRKGEGGTLLTPLWSHDPGLYAVPAAGGTPKLVRRQGERPHFGAKNDRVFFLDSEPAQPYSKYALRSIALTGAELRTVVISDDAVDMRVSPDEKWIAFTELFQSYITAFPPTGQAFSIGPKASGVPVHKLTRDAGENIHWSADSQTLFWSLGPELFQRDLKDAFPFVAGAPEKLPDPAEHGLNISFRRAYDRPSGLIALTGARLITMKGDEVIENGVVVVDGNRIAAIGPQKSVVIPAGAKRIDVSGKTIIPGMVDAHAHGPYAENGIVPRQNWAHYAQVAFGITTTHDPSSDTDTVFAASEMAKAGLIVAPRVFSTGTILYGAHAPIRAEINSLDDARSHLRRLQAVGAFSVKSYNQPRREQRQQVIAAARELGMLVVPEGGSLFNTNMTMVADGHTGIEHAVPVERFYDDVLQFWPKTKVGYTPTLVVAYGGIWGENYWYQHTNVWENERLLRYVPRFIVDPRSRRRMMAPEDEFNHVKVAAGAKALLDRGGHVQLGAHGQLQGLGPHWEMWMFVQGGMTPMESLRTATLMGAQYLGLDKDIGSLEAGKLADLAVLEQNPLEDIRRTEHVRYTMVNGRLYECDTMNEVGIRAVKRSPFFFEKLDNGNGAGGVGRATGLAADWDRQ